ncbi:hypothetical protein HID58_060158 [Brassica napus]|uniref:RNase H type-1 domain-containing protein n=1 Tax=Brassica napus TaxID=3708 RepID=A0ABQ7ZVJ7_BRANA|nr:hypothetical protein HID58_060158 [Brassica napus]
MALLYISHADETERRARIERVRQGIAENAADAAMRITKITSDINKDKSIGSMVEHKNPFDTLEREAESSDTSGVAISAPAAVCADFQPNSVIDLTLKISGLLLLNSSSWDATRINFPRAEEPQPPLRAQETSVSWVKPPTGFRICNIGVSWISRHVNCGAAWILRDDKGRGILHSRRAFSNVESKREAELLAMQWAVRDMVSTRQPRIVFESSCDQARDTFMNLPSYVEHPSVVNEILLHLRSLHDGAFTTVFERRILLLRIFLLIESEAGA